MDWSCSEARKLPLVRHRPFDEGGKIELAQVCAEPRYLSANVALIEPGPPGDGRGRGPWVRRNAVLRRSGVLGTVLNGGRSGFCGALQAFGAAGDDMRAGGTFRRATISLPSARPLLIAACRLPSPCNFIG